MNRTEKTKMIHNARDFIHTHDNPEGLAILTRMGAPPNILTEGKTLLEALDVRASALEDAKALYGLYVTEKDVKEKAAVLMINGLTALVRIRFGNQHGVLKALGLETRRKTQNLDLEPPEDGEESETSPDETESPEPGEPEADEEAETTALRAVPRSKAERMVVTGWRRLLTGVRRLPEHLQSVFTSMGYDDALLQEMETAVTQFQEASRMKREAFANRQAEQSKWDEAEHKVFQWVFILRRVSRSANAGDRLDKAETLPLMPI